MLSIPLNEPISREHLFLFYSLQVLDVYSTYRGTKYDCVYELNPLLPEKPKVYQMVTLKGGILGPLLFDLHRKSLLTDETLYPATGITGLVVINNFQVLDRAKKRCNKI